MGYEKGKGLGKDLQGRVNIVEASKQRGRRGLGASDVDFFTRAVPGKSLITNRAPGFSEKLRKEDQLKEARVAVSEAEKRKKESQTYHQNPKRPRYDEYRKDASRGRERSSFFGSSGDKFRQSFRDCSNRSMGDNKIGGREGRGTQEVEDL